MENELKQAHSRFYERWLLLTRVCWLLLVRYREKRLLLLVPPGSSRYGTASKRLLFLARYRDAPKFKLRFKKLWGARVCVAAIFVLWEQDVGQRSGAFLGALVCWCCFVVQSHEKCISMILIYLISFCAGN